MQSVTCWPNGPTLEIKHRNFGLASGGERGADYEKKFAVQAR